MVTNHARKTLAREIVARSEGRTSYSTALARAKRIESLRGKSGVAELSRSDQAVAAQAAELVIEGRDLIVFGGPAFGKSLATYAVLQETRLRTLFVADDHMDAAIVRSQLSGLNCSVESLPDSGELTLDPSIELLVIDEPRTWRPNDYSNLLVAKHRILSVHGHSTSGAQQRLGSILPGLELRDPFFLQAEYAFGTTGQKSFRLHR